MKNLTFALVFLTLGGCASSYNVNFDYERGTNFRKYTTFMVENPPAGVGDAILNSTINQERIGNALSTELKARGYVPTTETPDLLVHYLMDSKDRQMTQNSGPMMYGWGMSPWMNNGMQTRTVELNRLIINLIDAESKKLVWQGWASGETPRRKDQDAIVRDKVYQIMQKYPYRAGSEANTRR